MVISSVPQITKWNNNGTYASSMKVIHTHIVTITARSSPLGFYNRRPCDIARGVVMRERPLSAGKIELIPDIMPSISEYLFEMVV